jgi:hypothetical protein
VHDWLLTDDEMRALWNREADLHIPVRECVTYERDPVLDDSEDEGKEDNALDPGSGRPSTGLLIALGNLALHQLPSADAADLLSTYEQLTQPHMLSRSTSLSTFFVRVTIYTTSLVHFQRDQVNLSCPTFQSPDAATGHPDFRRARDRTETASARTTSI